VLTTMGLKMMVIVSGAAEKVRITVPLRVYVKPFHTGGTFFVYRYRPDYRGRRGVSERQALQLGPHPHSNLPI